MICYNHIFLIHFRFVKPNFYKVHNIWANINESDTTWIYYSKNSLSSSYFSAYVGVILFIKLGQTKIRYLGVEIFIKQDISGLYVPMNNFQSWFLMEISQTSSNTNANILPCWPIQSYLRFFWTFICKSDKKKKKKSDSSSNNQAYTVCKKLLTQNNKSWVLYQIKPGQGYCFPCIHISATTDLLQHNIHKA